MRHGVMDAPGLMMPHGIGKHNLTVPKRIRLLVQTLRPTALLAAHTDFASSLGAIRRLMEGKSLSEAGCQFLTTVNFLTTSTALRGSSLRMDFSVLRAGLYRWRRFQNGPDVSNLIQ
jgi:hypothetical protein